MIKDSRWRRKGLSVLGIWMAMSPLAAIDAAKGGESDKKGSEWLTEITEVETRAMADLYDLNRLSVQPSPRFQVKPLYPFALRKAGITGEAVIAFIVTSSGEVVEAYPLRATHPEFGAAAVQAVSQWKFRPGMVDGRKVNTRLQVPLYFNLSNPVQAVGAYNVPPQVVRQKVPHYPEALSRFGAGAKVVLVVSLSAAGKIESTHVKTASHPGFDDAALAAVADWKFKPAEKDGRKIASEMNLDVIIPPRDNGAVQAGWSPARPATFPASLDERYHWDQAPVIRTYAPPVYPREALMENREGRVQVKFHVNANGKVEQAQVTGGGDKDLAAAALAAANASVFYPAQKGGVPSPAWVEWEYVFDRSRRSHAPVSDQTERVLKLMRKSPDQVLPMTVLDSRPQLIVSQAPLIPADREIPEEGIRVMVEVVVDRDGVVRVPRLREDSDQELGFQAVQAVGNWRFEVPRKDGKPVDTYVTIPLVFKPVDQARARPAGDQPLGTGS